MRAGHGKITSVHRLLFPLLLGYACTDQRATIDADARRWGRQRGANAVVVKDVPAGAVAVGVPAVARGPAADPE